MLRLSNILHRSKTAVLLAAVFAVSPLCMSAMDTDSATDSIDCPREIADTLNADLPMAMTMAMAMEEEQQPWADRYLPQAPNSAALERYGEYPVSHATGVPQISIPVYTIQAGGYTLPISLSYHAGGVRVDDIAGVVGLGWSLNAGGAITRTIEGVADFTLASPYDTLFCTDSNIGELITESHTTLLENLLTGGRENHYDTQSDRYCFNFADKSGIMRYSFTDGRFIPLNHYPFRVEFFREGLPGYNEQSTQGSAFVITDTDGTRYTFHHHEMVGPSTDEGMTDISAWYLSEIVTCSNDTIAFQYSYDSIFGTSTISYVAKMGIKYGYTIEEDIEEYTTTGIEYKTFPPSNAVYKQLLLDRIQWRGNSVVFNYSGDRSDIAPSRLASIDVVNCLGDTLRSVSLSHVYFGASALERRMMLDKVVFSDLGEFSFSYYGNSQGRYLPPYTVPNMTGYEPVEGCFGKGQDYWGYFNGQTGIPIPGEILKREKWIVDDPHWRNLMDAEVDSRCASMEAVFDFARTATLKEIRYPGGGTTTFTYEPNGMSSLSGGLRIKSIRSVSLGNEPDLEKTYTYLNGNTYIHPREYMWWLGTRAWVDVSGGTQHKYPCVYVHNTPLAGRKSGTPHVFYTAVMESYPDGSYVDYEYEEGTHLGLDFELPGDLSQPHHPAMSYFACYDEGHSIPLLVVKRHYDSDGSLVLTEENNYDTVVGSEFVTGTNLVSTLESDMGTIGLMDHTERDGRVIMNLSYIHHRQCTAQPKFTRLLSIVTTDYTTGMSSTTAYTYPDNTGSRTLQPRSVTVSNGDNLDLTTVNTFVFEQDDPVSRIIADDYGACDLVTRTKLYRGGELASTTATEYTLIDHDDTGLGFTMSRMLSAIGSADLTEEVRLEGFDRYGNPSLVIENGCDSTFIRWGHNGMYPICSTRGSLSVGYGHKPLFGMTSLRTPSGHTTLYDYGAGGRLARVSDPRGKIAEYSYSPTSIVSRTYIDSLHCIESVRWHDGLGRPVSTVSQAPLQGAFVAVFTQYDSLGRESRTWLPVSVQSTDEISTFHFSGIASSTYPGEGMPYSDTEYDALGRVVSTGTPGDSWQGRCKRKVYGTNHTRDVKLYSAPTSEITLSKDGYWPAATLSSVTSIDEDGLALQVFTDKEGRTVLERRGKWNESAGAITGSSASLTETYYIHNNYGQLRYVLSPQYQQAGYKAKYGYEYRYDNLGRLVKKILPDCAPQQFWYSDRSSRPAFFQDGELAAAGRFRYFLYDREGRPTEQGISSARIGELPGRKTEKRLFYDAYSFLDNEADTSIDGYVFTFPDSCLVSLSSAVSSDLDGSARHSYQIGYDVNTPLSGDRLSVPTGLPTGVLSVLSDGTTMLEVTVYDTYERAVVSRTLHPDGRISAVETLLSYQDKPLCEYTDDPLFGPTLEETTSYNPSTGHLGSSAVYTGILSFPSRRLQARQTTAYDALGRVVSLTRTGDAGRIDYTYNLHGQLASIVSDGFSEWIHYTDPVASATPRYNGMISSIEWKGGGENLLRGYAYEYDNLGRLTWARYGEGEGLSDHTGRYDEKILEYSPNSMPKRLQRRGLKQDGVYGKVDNLHIGLDGNRIVSVTDDALPVYRDGAMDFDDGAASSAEYEYDSCGRLIRDDNKGIELIRYDDCGYPKEILFTGGNRTKYVYTPDGRKVRAVHLTALAPVASPLAEAAVFSADTTDYAGRLVFVNGVSARYSFNGGYIAIERDSVGVGQPRTYRYMTHYYDTDHLGNIRTVTDVDGNIAQMTHYYPFGGVFADASTGQSLQPYKYNGKELDRMHGLDWYDYGFRSFDPILHTWDRMDPLCEEYYHLSPYCYCAGNPVNNVDLLGLKINDIDGILAYFQSQIDNRLSNLKDSNDSNHIKQLISEYKKIIDEIDELKISDQVYTIKKWGKTNQGLTQYDTNTNEVVIYVDSQLGIIAHELKHGYQFETGEISFSANGTYGGGAFDLYDELDAYNRSRIVEFGIFYFSIPNHICPDDGFPYKLTIDDVPKKGKKHGIDYDRLSKQRISVKVIPQ